MCFRSLEKATEESTNATPSTKRQVSVTTGSRVAMVASVLSGSEPESSFETTAHGLVSKGCERKSQAANTPTVANIAVPTMGQLRACFSLLSKKSCSCRVSSTRAALS